MKYTPLGRSGLRVSKIALGTMNFGPRTSEEDSFRILDRALELGINIVDTADRYGNPHGSGQTEQIIGKWLKKTGNRNRIVLATKVFGPMGPGPNDYGLSAYHGTRGLSFIGYVESDTESIGNHGLFLSTRHGVMGSSTC